MASKRDRLLDLIGAELDQPAPPAVQALAAAAAAPFGESVAAALFYGSCLRDGVIDGHVVDLYLLVDDYAAAHGNRLEALANRLLPPNVYARTQTIDGTVVAAKVAVLSVRDFIEGARGDWFDPYLWARFSQPCALIFCRDAALRARLLEALAAAPRHLLTQVGALLPADAPAGTYWTRAFAETYRCELRAEQPDRGAEIYRLNSARFDAVFALLDLPQGRSAPSPRDLAQRWVQRRWLGKALSVLRLLKAAYTYRDGAHYVLWKIERHSGVRLELTPWQARHPIIASPWLAWRLWSMGGFH